MPPSSFFPARALARPSRRSLATTPTPTPIATPSPLPPVSAPPSAVHVPSTVGSFKPRRPIGAFRGGLLGFLFGFSLASAYASYHLLEEYRKASETLLTSVRELELSTHKMADHVKRIEEVERKVGELKADGAGKEDVKRLRGETKKVYDSLRLEFLDVKSHVWALEQDLGLVTKSNTYQIR